MNLQEWRKVRAEGEPARLPSGLDVRLRRVVLLDLLQQGSIPQTLHAQVDAVLAGGQNIQITVDTFTQYAGVINAVVKACIVEPSELDVTELPHTDRTVIFNWAQQEEAGELEFFRPQPERAPDPGQNGAAIRHASQPVSGAASE